MGKSMVMFVKIIMCVDEKITSRVLEYSSSVVPKKTQKILLTITSASTWNDRIFHFEIKITHGTCILILIQTTPYSLLVYQNYFCQFLGHLLRLEKILPLLFVLGLSNLVRNDRHFVQGHTERTGNKERRKKTQIRARKIPSRICSG